jgi:ATP-dependent DNA helicase PIF1
MTEATVTESNHDPLAWLDDPEQDRPEYVGIFGHDLTVVVDPGDDLDLETLPIPETLTAPKTSWLLGAAGTGKTTLARAMTIQRPGTILAATTGIAAINLGEGTTINALLKYFDTESLREATMYGALQMTLRKLYFRGGVRHILLDEVSMLDGQQLTLITQALREFAGDGYDVLEVDPTLEDAVEEMEAGGETFEGIKLTVAGDFAQLPPVKAPFAFESPVWEAYAAHRHTLTRVYRQADVDFRAALDACRRGEVEPVIEFFRHRMVTATDNHFDGSTIMATNEAVSRFNALRMVELPTAPVTYTARRWGTQRGDWKQIPDAVGLKKGALVMILANEREIGVDGMPGRLIYANGDLATIEELVPPGEPGAAVEGRVYVRLHRNARLVEVMWTSRNNEIPLEGGRRKALRAEGLYDERVTADGKREIIGTVEYLPIRVAYATTVHKSQGLSLDAVQIATREGFFTTPGMLYVALSRCRTAEGLRVIGTVDGLRARVKVHPKIRPWV